MGIVPEGQGYKGLPAWFGARFPTFAQGCQGLPEWLGALFSTFARLTEGGRGGLKLFGQCPYRTNTFQKGASLSLEWFYVGPKKGDRVKQIFHCFAIFYREGGKVK